MRSPSRACNTSTSSRRPLQSPARSPYAPAFAVVAIGLGLALVVLLLRYWVDGDDSRSRRNVAQNLGAASLFLATPLPTTLSNLDKTLLAVTSHDRT